MAFNTLTFFFIFIFTVGTYHFLAHKWQNWLLLIVSFFFYGYWDFRFLYSLVCSIGISYATGQFINYFQKDLERKALLVFGICLNLAILCYYKYYNFFARELHSVLSGFGLSYDPIFSELILPIGISFFVFQNISYIVDIYERKITEHHNFLDFALFIVFFPQLVAGPIERAAHFLPQIVRNRTVTMHKLKESTWLLLYGYFQKVVVADNLAPLVKYFFNNPREFQGFEILCYLIAGAFFVYADFSGYSKIAQGLAGFFGFKLTSNFIQPSYAISVVDFFRRWNVSVTAWFRDYLGEWLKRMGIHQSVRIMIVTTTIGLWHGASWKFLIWGMVNGVLILVTKSLNRFNLYEKSVRTVPAFKFLWPHILFVTVFVPMTATLFLVSNLGDAVVLFHRLFYPSGEQWKLILATLASFVSIMFAIDSFAEFTKNQSFVVRWPFWGQVSMFSFIFLTILLCGDVGTHGFVYFQF